MRFFSSIFPPCYIQLFAALPLLSLSMYVFSLINVQKMQWGDVPIYWLFSFFVVAS